LLSSALFHLKPRSSCFRPLHCDQEDSDVYFILFPVLR